MPPAYPVGLPPVADHAMARDDNRNFLLCPTAPPTAADIGGLPAFPQLPRRAHRRSRSAVGNLQQQRPHRLLKRRASRVQRRRSPAPAPQKRSSQRRASERISVSRSVSSAGSPSTKYLARRRTPAGQPDSSAASRIRPNGASQC